MTEKLTSAERESTAKAEMLGTKANEVLNTLFEEAKKLGFNAGITIAMKLHRKEYEGENNRHRIDLIASNHASAEIGVLTAAVSATLELMNDSSCIEDLALVAELDMRGVLDDFIELNSRFKVVYSALTEMKTDKQILNRVKEIMANKDLSALHDFLKQSTEGKTKQ